MSECKCSGGGAGCLAWLVLILVMLHGCDTAHRVLILELNQQATIEVPNEK